MESGVNHTKSAGRAAPPLLWLKQTVRYALHLFALYQVVRLSANLLPDFIYRTLLPAIQRRPPAGNPVQFLFSHLLALSLVPAFVAGLVINSKFRHAVARYIWVVPVGMLAIAFVFGPGMYPTTILESDFGQALNHFFGGGIHVGDFRDIKNFSNNWRDWYRAYSQLRFTMPAYAATAYSLGAWLGMSNKSRKLQAFMENL